MRTDVVPYLSAARLAEFAQAIAFQCHKTADYFRGRQGQAAVAQQCVGMMILLRRSGYPNAMMQVGERLGGVDLSGLDDTSPVYRDIWAAIVAHGGDPAELLPRWMQPFRADVVGCGDE